MERKGDHRVFAHMCFNREAPVILEEMNFSKVLTHQ